MLEKNNLSFHLKTLEKEVNLKQKKGNNKDQSSNQKIEHMLKIDKTSETKVSGPDEELYKKFKE